MIVGVLAALAVLPTLPALPACVFRAATGVPCPTCGTTRGVFALLHGDLRSALRFNPLSAVVVAVLIRRCFVLFTQGTRFSVLADNRRIDHTLMVLFFCVGSLHYFLAILPVVLAN